ncbi:hypothetical protein C7999DRAFT_14480 [Corynascus novoguineensis]|uniref:Uncharacterized protein n=1 Tax=Corynascus novoguineensis TaxID=1126955 RepID=A0AAN7CT84_9PEZI|nr:hypothetical protein C7999DRAFT_14480 [Corynascus novoguineensis]
MEELNLLILGAGWTATFLIPLLRSRNISFAATTTTGRPVVDEPTLPFKFNPSAPEHEIRSAIAALPRARHILITFPLTGAGPSKLLHSIYTETHLTSASTSSIKSEKDSIPFRFIQLGSTGIWQQRQQQSSAATPAPASPSSSLPPSPWLTRHSPYARETNPRAVAEDELLALGGCVLNLAGLWGDARNPRGWARRVAPTRDAVRAKASLHLVHGLDVARAIVRLVEGGNGDESSSPFWERVGRGQRWMVTDGFVYDWWALLAGWAEEEEENEGGEQMERARWVFELMREEGVRGLPRSPETLGRCYDTRDFWETFGLVPLKARVC